jgi:surface protein
MKNIKEFINESLYTLSDDIKQKIDNQETVIANDVNIKNIIKYAIKKLGNEADLNFIDTSGVTKMSHIFKITKFNGDISKWDVSNVTDMYCMFLNCPIKEEYKPKFK